MSLREYGVGLVLVVSLAACTTTTTPVSAVPQAQGQQQQQMQGTTPPPTSAATQRARAKAHVDLGNAYVDAGKFGVALDEANEAIGYDPAYAPAYLLKAQVHAYLEEYEQARVPFEKAVSLAPTDPMVNNAYGWFLCTQGREVEGISRLEQAARNPYYQKPAMAWTNVGTCQLRRKDDRAAEAAFIRAIQIDGSSLRALYNLADISYRAGNYPRAMDWIASLQSRMPEDSPEVLWLALRIERKLGHKEAEAEYALKLRRKFNASEEYQALMLGKFD